jgi:hypothetical protein
MPGLAFLHPALLWGLALGAVPILLHLLQRRRYRVRRWAAMEFLRTTVRRSSRRLRIEQWLLLLVRALILILAALALARPVWHSPRWSWLGSRAASQVVLVLDDSYGLGWRLSSPGSRLSAPGSQSAADREPGAESREPVSGATQFEAARARALELVRTGLTPGDLVSLVLASEPARAVVRRPTFNLKEIEAQLQRVTLADRPPDMAGAARLCREILHAPRSGGREVYLFTNAQAVGWKKPEAVDAWRQVAAVSRLHFIPTLPARGSNLAIDDLRVSGPPVAGRSLALRARVASWGDGAAGDAATRDVVVTLHVDGEPAASTRLRVPALGTGEAQFEHTFAAAGPHTVMVSLPEDGLTTDNRRYASLTARDRVKVLVLNGHPDPDPRRDAAFFVAAALAPGLASNGDGGRVSLTADPTSPFGVQVVDGSSFHGTDLSQWDVVVLTDVPRLSDADRRRLVSFVSGGGGLLILPGPSALPAFYNVDLLTRLPGLMPARIGPTREAGAAAPALELGAAGEDHPVLARFRDAADVDLSTARFERYFRLQPLGPASGARVLCRFTDGSPALAERSVGLGRVTLLASPPLPGWNTLPFKPAFVPFLDGLVGYLGQGPNKQHNLRVGDPLVWAVPPAGIADGATREQGGAALVGPDGRRLSLQPSREDNGTDSVRELSLDSTPRAGLYHLLWRPQGAESGRPGSEDWFAANLDTSASDLRPLSRRQFEAAFHPAAVRWVDPHEALAAVVRDTRQGREAWRGLLLGALALMLCESGMAQLFGRRRGHD